MTENRAFKPYSSLPEPFALVAAAVWVNLLVAAAPTASTPGLVVRTVVYGMLLAVAAAHSWLFARGTLVSGGAQRAAVSAGWLALLALVLVWVESESPAPLVGVLVFMQVAQCSFVFNHATLRLTHLVSFFAMLATTPRLPLAGAGAAWLVFAVLSMLVLAYGRTASKAGPASFDLGESRRVTYRLTLVSTVALLAAVLFFLTPLLRWPETPKRRPPQDRFSRGQREPAGEDPFGIGGSTSLDPENLDIRVMFVQTQPAVSGPLYLRGETFDTFDGAEWSSSPRGEQALDVSDGGWTTLPFPKPRAKTVRFRQLTQTYTMLVNMRGVVFTACRPTQVQFPEGSTDELLYDVTDRSLRVDGDVRASKRYRVDGFEESFADDAFVDVADVTRAGGDRYLRVPDGVDPRVVEIAREQTAGATNAYQKALALERYLHGSDFYYSLDHGIAGPQVVNDFLLRERRGHCALFASAMAVMARAVGVPSRYVTGFLAQDRGADGFTVRGSDAHAWVEIFAGDAGWIAFDPTSGRVAPSDSTTRRLARAGGHEDTRTDMGVERGGGLYGRDGSDFSVSGGAAGTSVDTGAGPATGGSGGGPDVTSADGAGGSSSGGRGSGAGLPEQGGGPAGGSGSGDAIASGREPGGSSTGDGTGSSEPDAGRTVIPPGGGTTLPTAGGRSGDRTGERVTAGTDTPTSTTTAQPRPSPPPSAEQTEGEWRLLVVLLLVVGAAGMVLLLVWRNVARRVVERRTIRDALPASDVEDDPDPRRFVVRTYHAMVAGLGRVGFPKRDADTPGDFASAVARRDAALAAPVGELTELFHVARYGDRPVTLEDAASARDAWRRAAGTVARVRTETEDLA